MTDNTRLILSLCLLFIGFVCSLAGVLIGAGYGFGVWEK